MWETLRKEEVLRNLKTNRKEGLESEEVKIRQEKFGKNILQEILILYMKKKKTKPYKRQNPGLTSILKGKSRP